MEALEDTDAGGASGGYGGANGNGMNGDELPRVAIEKSDSKNAVRAINYY